jgi:hypothetical protein
MASVQGLYALVCAHDVQKQVVSLYNTASSETARTLAEACCFSATVTDFKK